MHVFGHNGSVYWCSRAQEQETQSYFPHGINDMDREISRQLSVTGLISVRAQQSPYSQAVVFEDKCLSYGELEAKSSRLADLLRAKGVRKGDRIVVLTNRCVELPILFCGVLKVGACYVPLDQDSLNVSRISHVVNHVEPILAIISTSKLVLECPALSLEEIQTVIGNDNDTSCNVELAEPEPDDLAYIIYTSGTTSYPKGVMVPHRALSNYVQQGSSEIPFNMWVTPEDRVCSIFSPGFDGKLELKVTLHLESDPSSLYWRYIFDVVRRGNTRDRQHSNI